MKKPGVRSQKSGVRIQKSEELLIMLAVTQWTEAAIIIIMAMLKNLRTVQQNQSKEIIRQLQTATVPTALHRRAPRRSGAATKKG
jgi:hypothetical protein